jgi:hypothetical protein
MKTNEPPRKAQIDGLEEAMEHAAHDLDLTVLEWLRKCQNTRFIANELVASLRVCGWELVKKGPP